MDKEKTGIICPKCGHLNEANFTDCTKCGVIFSKYYEILKKQKEEEKAEALRKQQEEEEKAEALRRQQEEEEKAEALRRQQEEEEKAEALRRQQEEEEKAEALRRQQEEEEKAEALRRQQKEEEKAFQKRIDDIVGALKPKMGFKDLLKRYEKKTISINYDNSSEFKDAYLIKVSNDIFSILIMDKKLMKSFLLRNIVSITESVNGVSIDNMEPPIIIELSK